MEALDKLKKAIMDNGGYDRDIFRRALTYKEQRNVLCEDFSLFKRRKNNHVGLTGTRYNFYCKMWSFGECVRLDKGYSVKYISLEDLLSRPMPEEVLVDLLFNIVFLSKAGPF